MELMVNKETVAINDVVFDGVQELPIESDFMLPDYCPDILRVLKCSLQPVVTSKQVTGEKLILDGMATLKVIYVSEAEAVCNYEHKLPFSKTVTLKNAADNPLISVSAVTDYVNCRAVSQRRLDVRSVISMTIKVTAQHGENVVCDASGQNIQLKKKETQNSVVVGNISRQFTVREELELSGSKPRISRVVNKTACAKVTDCKLIANKVIMKGDLLVCLLYVAEGSENQLCKCEFSLPLSQVFDADGVDESCKASICLQIFDCEVELRPDLDEEGSALDLEVTIGADIRAYCNCNISAVCDLYSTEFETSYQTRPVTLNNLQDIVHEQYSERNTFDLPDEAITEVSDVWCDATVRNVKFVEGEMCVTTLIKICMLAKNEEDKIQYYERAVDSEYKYKVTAFEENMTAECEMKVLSSSFALGADSSVEITTEIDVISSIFSVSRENIISEIQVDEETSKKALDLPALTLYYADKDESIWEIAKQYNTSVTAILEQNEITEEILSSRQMLLIPVTD